VVDFPGSAGAINRVVLTGRRGLALEARAA
jgi:hypothetical protein